MAGVPSAGMLLCANDGGEGDARTVQSLRAPEGAVPGERLTWGDPSAPLPHGANKVAKKKLGKRRTRLGRQRQERGDVERDSAHLVRWAGERVAPGGGGALVSRTKVVFKGDLRRSIARRRKTDRLVSTPTTSSLRPFAARDAPLLFSSAPMEPRAGTRAVACASRPRTRTRASRPASWAHGGGGGRNRRRDGFRARRGARGRRRVARGADAAILPLGEERLFVLLERRRGGPLRVVAFALLVFALLLDAAIRGGLGRRSPGRKSRTFFPYPFFPSGRSASAPSRREAQRLPPRPSAPSPRAASSSFAAALTS